MRSGGIQAVTKGLEEDFCVAGLGRLRQKDKPQLEFLRELAEESFGQMEVKV